MPKHGGCQLEQDSTVEMNVRSRINRKNKSTWRLRRTNKRSKSHRIYNEGRNRATIRASIMSGECFRITPNGLVIKKSIRERRNPTCTPRQIKTGIDIRRHYSPPHHIPQLQPEPMIMCQIPPQYHHSNHLNKISSRRNRDTETIQDRIRNRPCWDSD